MRRERLTILALLFAMTFPTVAAWSYFLGLAGSAPGVNPWQQAAYVLGKVVQFGFPLAFLGFLNWRTHCGVTSGKGRVGREEVGASSLATRPSPLAPRSLRPHFRGLGPALIFGLAVAAVMLGVYFGALRGSSLLAKTPAMVRHKLEEVNMATPLRYAVLAVFVVMAHSLLEEYYWRWFVFGGLRQFLSLTPAMLLSSLAFMAHHVVVLYVYLPGKFWSAVLPFALAVAVGGAVWAWLYERNGSLAAPWLSHLIIDAAIFVIGWDLLWPIAKS
jgi:membrane protease YdiL (CAAX protease family)